MLRRLLLAALCACAAAHSRWVCPPPRDASVGLKSGPCGGAADSGMPPMVLQPGPMTVVWEEAVGHAGAPARIALSLDGTDDGTEQCVLLDHIPHNDAPAVPPVPGLEGSYMRSRLTLRIPDVRCARCTLQLITSMTDAVHGVPPGTRCALRGADTPPGAAAANATLPPCPAYHSCAPVAINGTGPARGARACSAQPADWPYRDRTPSVYDSAADTATWSRQGWLLDAPLAYRAPAGPCVAPPPRRPTRGSMQGS